MAVVFDMEKKYPGAIDGMSNPTVIGSAAAGDGALDGTLVGATVGVMAMAMASVSPRSRR